MFQEGWRRSSLDHWTERITGTQPFGMEQPGIGSWMERENVLFGPQL